MTDLCDVGREDDIRSTRIHDKCHARIENGDGLAIHEHPSIANFPEKAARSVREHQVSYKLFTNSGTAPDSAAGQLRNNKVCRRTVKSGHIDSS